MTETFVNFFKHAADDVADKSLCIVALPASDSPTLPIGSEEKHATLLMLGDDVDPTSAALVQASIDNVVRNGGFAPFTERVSRVTSLGDKGARVWMIDSDNGLKMMRDRLVRIPAIRALYDMEKQYPNYTPHVTIGYPNQGEEYLSGIFEGLASNIDRIKFDRLGLWYGDNHDTTWRLSPNDPMDSVEASVGHDDLAGLALNHAREVAPALLLPVFTEFLAHTADLDGEEFMSSVDTFFAHFGVKGMKWGVRRSDAQLAKAAETRSSESGEGSSSSSSSSSANVSEDALRFIEKSQQPPVALTDQEIRQVLDRARITKQYNEIFNPETQPNSELRQKVEKLRLEKEFSQLNSEMNPSLASRLSSLIQNATKGFEAYQKLDEVSDNKLTNQIRKAFKLPPIKEPRSKTLSREIKSLEQEKKHAKLIRDLKEMGIDITSDVAAVSAAGAIAG